MEPVNVQNPPRTQPGLLIATPDAVVRLEKTAHMVEKRRQDREAAAAAIAEADARDAAGAAGQQGGGGFLRFFCFKSGAPPNEDFAGVVTRDQGTSIRSMAARKAPLQMPWNVDMETTVLACINHVERQGINEERPFAVSASQDDIEDLQIPFKSDLPETTDVHVACAVIKMLIRNATEPLVSVDIASEWLNQPGGAVPAAETFATSSVLQVIQKVHSQNQIRGRVLGRLLKLLGSTSARIEVTRMGASNLAICLTPSLLQWNCKDTQALVALSGFNAFVVTLIDESRLHTQSLDKLINSM